MKKKLMAVILSAMLVMTLTACADNADESSVTDTETNQDTETADDAQTTDDIEAEDTNEASETDENVTGKTLVVYYSATGNTKEVAEMIAAQTGGDLFELVPTDVYTNDDLNWRNEDSRVSVEHDNPDARDVELTAQTVDNWDEYDTVYIGYPIWWGIAAWPVDTFVEVNDFSGKTVIPFATAASSGMGESGELLEELAGTGDWLDGECFRGRTSEEDIADWIASY